MMKLGLFVAGDGHHIAAWRDPSTETDANQDIAHFARIARIGEQGRFDFLFTADTNAFFYGDDLNPLRLTSEPLRLEPLTLLSYLSAITDYIGLICTATTTYLEPFHVARLFGSLDKISGGRAGWNLVTSSAPAEALNFSSDEHPSAAERYERAAEFAEVVFGLWDSWEDDAVVADHGSGVYFNPDRVHRLNHKGKHFQVQGPLNLQRSPQGRPLIVQAGQSDLGRDLAARTAEIVFTVQPDMTEAQAFYADIKHRAVTFGRAANEIKVMPGLLAVVGETRDAAEEKLARIQALIVPELGLSRLSGMVGMDLTGYSEDGYLPEIATGREQPGRQKVVVDLARRENLTIRQLYQRVTGVRAHRILCGTPDEIVDSMQAWVEAGAADGFNIMSLTYPDELEIFVDHVIPVLQRRGLFRTEYESRTLRGNLGIPIPENRWVHKRKATNQTRPSR